MTLPMAKYSIIVPVYNVAPFLSQCVSSVLNQTYKNFELLLIDDGSTDSSSQICDNYADADNRVQVIRQSNQGLSAARNQGIDHAVGIYLLFLDSDDYWHDSQVLERIDSRLTATQPDVLSFNYVKFTGSSFALPYFRHSEDMPRNIPCEQLLDYQLHHNLWIACAWNKVVKRALFASGKLRFQCGITAEDIDWCFRLALQAETFDYSSDVVVCYRQRATSISRGITPERIGVLLDNIDRCLDLMKNDNTKAQILKPYISYQYATAIYRMAFITPNAQYRQLLTRITRNRNILRWSNDNKVRLIYLLDSIAGIGFVIKLLRIHEKISSFFSKEGNH